jgi:hypothetical protein
MEHGIFSAEQGIIFAEQGILAPESRWIGTTPRRCQSIGAASARPIPNWPLGDQADAGTKSI